MERLPHNDKLDICAFENMLDLAYMTNSYKIYWFFSIFEDVRRGRKVIPFREAVLRMVCKSWYSVVQYKLNLGVMDQLGSLVDDIRKKYDFKSDIPETELYNKLNEIEDDEIESDVSNFYKYVPYRLLTPFYDLDLRGIPDCKRNKAIAYLSVKDDRAIYKILGDTITINDNWFDYICQNQLIIEGWLNYRLIYYLQKKNPNVPAIPLKIYPPQTRDLAGAKKFWKAILNIRPLIDIYTGRPLTDKNLSIDHFIPWSFVMHDELWNLVPTSRDVNSSKSDGLPDLGLYLEKFCDMQYTALAIAVEKGFHKKDIECYLNFNIDVSRNSLNLMVFNHRLHETIKPLYQLARNQGFMVWKWQN